MKAISKNLSQNITAHWIIALPSICTASLHDSQYITLFREKLFLIQYHMTLLFFLFEGFILWKKYDVI